MLILPLQEGPAALSSPAAAACWLPVRTSLGQNELPGPSASVIVPTHDRAELLL